MASVWVSSGSGLLHNCGEKEGPWSVLPRGGAGGVQWAPGESIHVSPFALQGEVLRGHNIAFTPPPHSPAELCKSHTRSCCGPNRSSELPAVHRPHPTNHLCNPQSSAALLQPGGSGSCTGHE